MPSPPSPARRPAAAALPAPAPWVEAGAPRVGELALRLAAWPGVLARHRDLVTTSVRRELSARFRGTLLGALWQLVQPLLLFAVYGFVFTELLGARVGADPDAPPGTLAVFMFSGVLVWSAVADSLSRAAGSVLEQRNLVQKVRFPAQLLPLHAALAALVPFVAGLAAFSLVAPAAGLWEPPGWRLLALGPPLLAAQLLLTAGLGLALAALQVLFRDTQPILAVALTVGMFATPVFWVPDPAALPGVERWLPLLELNPFAHLVGAWRALLLSLEPGELGAPDAGRAVAVCGAFGAAAFALGSLLFFRVERHLADEV
jgi:lipopolysaccharide transport system permease protein